MQNIDMLTYINKRSLWYSTSQARYKFCKAAKFCQRQTCDESIAVSPVLFHSEHKIEGVILKWIQKITQCATQKTYIYKFLSKHLAAVVRRY